MSQEIVDTHVRRACWLWAWNGMSLDAVLLDKQSVAEVARAHDISRFWLHKLLARFREGGYAALEPRSRRPRSCANAASPEIHGAIVRWRHQLTAAGHDNGPHSIAHHLRLELGTAPSVATIWRILQRHRLITPQPHKTPSLLLHQLRG